MSRPLNRRQQECVAAVEEGRFPRAPGSRHAPDPEADPQAPDDIATDADLDEGGSLFDL